MSLARSGWVAAADHGGPGPRRRATAVTARPARALRRLPGTGVVTDPGRARFTGKLPGPPLTECQCRRDTQSTLRRHCRGRRRLAAAATRRDTETVPGPSHGARRGQAPGPVAS
jgi:hypothetical protein